MLNDNSQFNSDGAGNNDHQYGFMRVLAMQALGLLPINLSGGAGAFSRDVHPNANYRLLASLATTNFVLVSATARSIHKVQGRKATAGAAWLKIYNKATLPTVADVPVMSIELQPSLPFDIDLKGLTLTLGLGISITALPADNDVTAIAAGDVVGLNVSWSS